MDIDETSFPRTFRWLEERFNHIWRTYYADVPRVGEILIRFGRKTSQRLGSIKRRSDRTIITVTGHFRDPTVPEYVVDETIAHELAHYTHGFESPLPKLYRYPHEGGIVRRELDQRGLGKIHQASRKWLATYWAEKAAVKRLRRRPQSRLHQLIRTLRLRSQ